MAIDLLLCTLTLSLRLWSGGGGLISQKQCFVTVFWTSMVTSWYRLLCSLQNGPQWSIGGVGSSFIDIRSVFSFSYAFLSPSPATPFTVRICIAQSTEKRDLDNSTRLATHDHLKEPSIYIPFEPVLID